MNYLNITYEQLLQDFRARLNSDPRFKNIGSATIYGMFQEMLCACMDMTNFYMQRTAEEAFISTARLDSSVIKHAKSLGYNPRRAIPARCELIIRLKGPLPSTLKEGTEIIFSQDLMDLSFNGNKYILDSGYSYILTRDDVISGQSNDWYKDLYFSVPKENATYIPLAGMSYYDTTYTTPIKCFQGERKTIEILGTANLDKIGEINQFYDINDLDFCDWYGKRDPYAFNNNVYDKTKSWCKVGIGADEDDAFSIYTNGDGSKHDNTYEIETQAIHLNDKVVNWPQNKPLDDKFKVCLIDTNSDKTVRLSFSTEPKICDIGLKSVKDNIYVKYIASKGKACNMTGVKGSVMSHTNNIYVSVDGTIIDITNNVQFIINSDIYCGEYFENQNSIKINAPAYFSSCGKLVTKDDYTAYFRALTSPIVAQNALVYGQHEIQKKIGNDITHKLIQNNIFYSILGHMYAKNNGNWEPRNLLTDTSEKNNDVTIYGSSYLDHICDFIKLLYSYEGYYNKIFRGDATEQWLKNARLIYENCKHKIEVNSILMPMVPFVQYFDVVGTVYVDPLTDIEEYTRTMKNKVYEYLDQKLATDRKIYKSEIIDLYNKNDNTKAVDIDIKISSIVKSDEIKYKWTDLYNKDFRIKQNYGLASYANARGMVKTDFEVPQKYGYGWWNEIQLSKTDQSGNILSEALFNGRKVLYRITFANVTGSDSSTATKYTKEYNIMCDVASDDNYIYLYPLSLQSEGDTSIDGSYRNMENRANLSDNSDPEIKASTEDGIVSIEISIATDNDYASTSNFSIENIGDYMLDANTFLYGVTYALTTWLNNLQETTSVQRAIPLPYIVDVPVEASGSIYDYIIRKEEIIRRGNLNSPIAKSISENSFWNYFVPIILDHFYANAGNGREAINDTTDYDSIEWQAATKLIMDIYPLIKPGICDSILDEHNNIVNFSTDMEVPVVYNKINVKYKAN